MEKIFYSFVVALLLAACSTNYDDVKVDDFRVNKITMESASKILIDASLKVDNPTKKKLTLKDGAFDVLSNGMVFAQLRMTGETEIPAKSAEYQAVLMELKITNMMVLLMSGIDIRNPELEKLMINGSLKVKSGVWSKTFPVENTTLEQLLKSL